MIHVTHAWAVIDNHGINIKSVSDSRRAAIVNWLCTEKSMMATYLATDEDIEKAWTRNSGGANVTQVSVRAIQ